MNYRIGYACKYMHNDRTLTSRKLEEIERPYNNKATTNKWLSSKSVAVAEERLFEIIKHNLESIKKQLKVMAFAPAELHMLRISSDILPFYTHSSWSYFYQQSDVKSLYESGFAQIGSLARKLDVRISFHPGQFVVLSSDNPNIVLNSVDEFEYHVDMLRMMGYGNSFQDAKCNVHMSGRRGAEGFREIYPKLSLEARNVITIENDEMAHGLDDVLTISDLVPIVLDIHHHWVNSGEYIQISDERVDKVIESWRGVRPTMHYSISREDYLVDQSPDELPDMAELLLAGYKKQKLRAHSEYMWNEACNRWAASFLPKFDIMVEAKCKNLASKELLADIKRFKEQSLCTNTLYA